MLVRLFAKDFAILAAAEVEFGAGLTVVTGETGAGKSLLVDALMLLTGLRADAGMVRAGCPRAELNAEFDIAALPAARDWLSGQAFDDGGACQLRRVIAAEGGSRAWINGRPATLAQLAELGALLVEVHGQNEHHALLSRTVQLAVLDEFGALGSQRAAVAASAHAWSAANARITELSRGADHAARIEFLQHQLAELEADALAPDVLAALEAEHRRLANTGELLRGCSGLADLLDGDSDFALTRLVSRAQGEAARLAGMDPRLASLAQLLEQAGIEAAEAADVATRYPSTLDLDPDRLAEADAKLARLHDLARKHRVPMAELHAHAEALRIELDALRGAGTEIARATAERDRHAAEWNRAAQALGKARAAAAKKLSAAVTALMAELGMGGGRFAVDLAASGRDEPDPQGAERVEFLVSANPGQPPRPLRKVASGGELSRIGLAIEVAALGADPVGTMVFDEVDAGIGGAVAEVVGTKLRTLGVRCQVLCVTHLPQVAAQANAHLRVRKSGGAGETRVEIDTLDGAARLEETARMLGGIEITRESRAHAKRMLEKSGSR